MKGSTITRRAVVAAPLTAGSGVSAAHPNHLFGEPKVTGAAGATRAADGQEIRYKTFGAGSRLVVFVHGWMCDRSYWNRQIDAFARSCRVLAIDLVGHGASDAGRIHWSMEGLGDDVARAIHAVGGDDVVMVGHSMGGPVAIEAVRRIGRAARGLVTIDILTEIDPIKRPRPPRANWRNYRTATRKHIRERMFRQDANPELADRIADAMSAAPAGRSIALSEALDRYDAVGGLAAVNGTPLTMINGQNRDVDVVAIRKAHPNARIFLVSGAGHFVMLDQPALFDALLRTEMSLMVGEITRL